MNQAVYQNGRVPVPDGTYYVVVASMCMWRATPRGMMHDV